MKSVYMRLVNHSEFDIRNSVYHYLVILLIFFESILPNENSYLISSYFSHKVFRIFIDESHFIRLGRKIHPASVSRAAFY